MIRTVLGIDPQRYRIALENDGEFRRASRGWTGSFAFFDGSRHLAASLSNGVVVNARSGDGTPEADITFCGPEEGWRQVFAAVPPPYYQDLLGGAVGRHGFAPSGDLAVMAAYYGAIRRAAVVAGRVLRGED